MYFIQYSNVMFPFLLTTLERRWDQNPSFFLPVNSKETFIILPLKINWILPAHRKTLSKKGFKKYLSNFYSNSIRVLEWALFKYHTSCRSIFSQLLSMNKLQNIINRFLFNYLERAVADNLRCFLMKVTLLLINKFKRSN